jgi:hypothetical protein
MEAARARGVSEGNVYIDPLAMTLTNNTGGALVIPDAMFVTCRSSPTRT